MEAGALISTVYKLKVLINGSSGSGNVLSQRDNGIRLMPSCVASVSGIDRSHAGIVLVYSTLLELKAETPLLRLQGDDCSISCPAGFYGINCSSSCSCHNEDSCSHLDGFCSCREGSDLGSGTIPAGQPPAWRTFMLAAPPNFYTQCAINNYACQSDASSVTMATTCRLALVLIAWQRALARITCYG